MLIKVDIEKITEADIKLLIERHKKEIDNCKKLQRYYDGDHAILNKQARSNGAPNNKVVANYCEYITHMCTGFFLGQPISYTSNNKKALEEINAIFKYNDEAAHNMDIAEMISIKGKAYELLYLDEDGKIRFAKLNPEEVILVADTKIGENIKFAIRHYDVYDVSGQSFDTYVDVYDKDVCTSYKLGNSLIFLSEADHMFSDVPIIEYLNNNQGKGDFEGIITLVDAYSKSQSLTLDDMEDFTDSFLILRNMSGTGETDVQEMRKNKVILVNDNGGAEWLIKNINDTYIENLKNRIQRDIHKFSNIPDMSDEKFTGNTSGIAIKYKLIGLEQIRVIKERKFKKSIQKRLELISNMLTIYNQKFDFRDIELTFTANIPDNLTELAELVTKLTGTVSKEKLLSLLPFISDPQAELEILQQENEFSLDGDSGGYKNFVQNKESSDES